VITCFSSSFLLLSWLVHFVLVTVSITIVKASFVIVATLVFLFVLEVLQFQKAFL
jgi:hypothetical protein